MAQQAHVPKFGNWENGDNTPYTAYFDTARKGKGGDKPVNPNDPLENPGAFSRDTHPVQAPPFRIISDQEVLKAKNQHRTSREDVRGPSGSPARNEAMPRKTGSESPLHPNSGDHYRRNNRMSQGSEHSVENSPLHPHHQVRSANKVGSRSPAWEKKGTSEGTHGLGSNTPGRSRMRTPFRGDDPPEKGSTIPKFGEWDESNPSSADGYSDVFNKVREEKKNSAAKVPIITTDPDFSTLYAGERRNDTRSSYCGCFSWFKK